MTIKQVQHLLEYLGYATGGCDGTMGPLTASAVRKFQEDFQILADGDPGPETYGALIKAINNGWVMPDQKTEELNAPLTGTFWDTIKHFTREEFRCKCGGKYCDGFPSEMQEKVVRLADAAREHFGRPATVSSGLRCEAWNVIQGGVHNSQHQYGEAIDMCIQGVSGAALSNWLGAQADCRYTYIIEGPWVHFDIDKIGGKTI